MKVFKQLFDRQIDEQSAWNAWLILNFGHFVELLLPLGCLGYRGRIRSIKQQQQIQRRVRCTMVGSYHYIVGTGAGFVVGEDPVRNTWVGRMSDLILGNSMQQYSLLEIRSWVNQEQQTDQRLEHVWGELTVKMMSLHKIKGFLPFTFSGNHKKIIKVSFRWKSKRLKPMLSRRSEQSFIILFVYIYSLFLIKFN
jgi:hypothetical protein